MNHHRNFAAPTFPGLVRERPRLPGLERRWCGFFVPIYQGAGRLL